MPEHQTLPLPEQWLCTVYCLTTNGFQLSASPGYWLHTALESSEFHQQRSPVRSVFFSISQLPNQFAHRQKKTVKPAYFRWGYVFIIKDAKSHTRNGACQSHKHWVLSKMDLPLLCCWQTNSARPLPNAEAPQTSGACSYTTKLAHSTFYLWNKCSLWHNYVLVRILGFRYLEVTWKVEENVFWKSIKCRIRDHQMTK